MNLTPNIDQRGRWFRALGAAGLLAGSVAALWLSYWLAGALFVSSLFVGFEALRGWCFLRACGIKTRL
jgi:hypothetical protein